MRGRFLPVIVTLTGRLFLHLGHRHVDDIQRTTSSLSEYVQTQLTAVFTHDQDLESTRWDDSQDPDLENESTSIKDPTFHLLIPASKPTLNLCKTLLSAAILDHPPPTPLGYGQEGDRDQPGADLVRDALKFLEGQDAREGDLVLIVDEDTLFQLPAEVLIDRFFHSTRDSTYALLQKHGRYPGNFTTLPSLRPQRYYTHVLFGAQKDCTSSSSSPPCYFGPQSPLPKDPHDPYHQQESEHRRPRYMASAMAAGTVDNLRPIYKCASELLETELGRNGSQHIFSHIFGGQEYRRELYHQSTLGPITKVSQWITSKLSSSSKYRYHLYSTISNNSSSSESDAHCEFGIRLDYISSVFQIIDPSSENDMGFLKFSNISESLNLLEKLMRKAHIPLDLNLTSPFTLHSPSKEPLTALDTLP